MIPKRCSQCHLSGRGKGDTLISLPGNIWRCSVCGYYYLMSIDRRGVVYVGKDMRAVLRLMFEDQQRKDKS